jgi:hypothetical protein
MNEKLTQDSGCCSGSSCGCRIDIYPTDKACPKCGKKLRLNGRAQTLEMRLSCRHCGYSSPLLSTAEISELI